MPFNIGTTELSVLLAIVILIFGASRIAQLGAGLGQGIREFRRALTEDESIDREIENSVG